MAYVDAAYLKARLSTETYIALFDNTGARDETEASFVAGVEACCDDASALADSRLFTSYGDSMPFVSTVPPMVIRLAGFYATAFAWMRNPDYLTAMKMGPAVEKLWALAEMTAMSIQSAELRLAAPNAAPEPTNVGGVVYSTGPRLLIDAADGTPTPSDF